MKLINLAFSLVAALGSSAGFAQAVTVDFDVVTNVNGTSFSSGGFEFVANGGLVVDDNDGCSPSCAQNGTNKLLSAYGSSGSYNSTVIMRRSNSGLFALSSFDGAGSFINNISYDPQALGIPTHIDVVGQLSTGGQVTQSFEIDKTRYLGGSYGMGILHFTPYTFTGFSNLTSATFSARGALNPVTQMQDQNLNGFTLDNIVATPVPEPESYAMMLVGVGLIGTVIRRRKSLQA